MNDDPIAQALADLSERFTKHAAQFAPGNPRGVNFTPNCGDLLDLISAVAAVHAEAQEALARAHTHEETATA